MPILVESGTGVGSHRRNDKTSNFFIRSSVGIKDRKSKLLTTHDHIYEVIERKKNVDIYRPFSQLQCASHSVKRVIMLMLLNVNLFPFHSINNFFFFASPMCSGL